MTEPTDSPTEPTWSCTECGLTAPDHLCRGEQDHADPTVGLTAEDVLSAITDVMADGLPSRMQFTDAHHDAVAANTWTLLPPGSHLRVWPEGSRPPERGADVIALRAADDRTVVITDRGDHLQLSDRLTLAIGDTDHDRPESPR